MLKIMSNIHSNRLNVSFRMSFLFFEITFFVVLTAINAEKMVRISGKERGVGPSILFAYISMIEIFAIPNIRVAKNDFIFLYR